MLQTCSRQLPTMRALACAALVAAALAGLAAPAFAGSVSGSTGLIDIPSADVLTSGDLELSARFVEGDLGFSAVYGVYDGVEVGVNTTRTHGGPVGFILKGTIYAETSNNPAIAIGLESGQSYAVLSKRVAPRVRLHAGFGFGRMDGVFAGVAVALNTVSSGGAAIPVTTLLAEYTPLGVNAGARLVFSPAFSAEVALLDLKEAAVGVSVRHRF